MTDTYYLRATDRAELVQIGVDLGLLIDDADGTRPADLRVSWTEIGTLTAPTGQLDAEGQPIRAPIVDANGTPYWHANLMIDDAMTLTEWAQQAHQRALDAGDQVLADKIAAHIAGSTAYFPLDANGQPRKPNAPQVVYWR